MMNTTNKKFSSKELRRINWRWIFHSQIGWNYERMQGLGYLTTMLPVIQKLYHDDPVATDKALRVHSQFFNTTPQMGDIIVGINIAIEEERGAEGIDTAASIKTALMGPFAGIGDTIFGMISGTVLGSIACSTAADGSFVGIALWTLWFLAVLFLLRPYMFNVGYREGVKLVTTMSNQLNALTEAAGVLGVTVIGSMIASMVNIKFGAFNLFGNTVDFQVQFLDKIGPKVGAAGLVAILYYLLGRKGMNSNYLIIIVIIFSILGAVTGVLVAP
ncbi:MAG: PTS system mannose/fructose/sorbose family transporter subunit IID [Bacilli bacterium]